MSHRFSELAFTPSVKRQQELRGSRNEYDGLEQGGVHHDELGPRERAFISLRDSFYTATVSETGWPYIQHRGGPVGFVQILEGNSICFADFRGNRRYISSGNLQNDSRALLFLMDYPNQTRLKLLGHARFVESAEAQDLNNFFDLDYRARVAPYVIVNVEAFDWNRPQHIVQLFTRAELLQLDSFS